jgi:hypothetical protein
MYLLVRSVTLLVISMNFLDIQKNMYTIIEELREIRRKIRRKVEN